MKEKLIELIEKGHREYFNRCSGMDKPFIVFIADYLFANDVVVQQKGEWIRQDETYTRFMCSNCKDRNYGMRYNFCPHCGADMTKGGAEHETD